MIVSIFQSGDRLLRMESKMGSDIMMAMFQEMKEQFEMLNREWRCKWKKEREEMLRAFKMQLEKICESTAMRLDEQSRDSGNVNAEVGKWSATQKV